MELYENIKYKFEYIPTSFPHLNEIEWKNMLKTFCIRLANKPVGGLLISKLHNFISSGYKITVSNNDYPMSSTIYPKIRYINDASVLIVIPSVPYFTYADTVCADICTDTDDSFMKNMEKVADGRPSKFRLKFSDKHRDYDFVISKTKMTFFIGFAHELIHALRHFERMDTDSSKEEDNTIYGIDGYTLKYVQGNTQTFITENTIRKEHGMDARISHDSHELFCYNVRFTHKNADNFDKQDYLK